MKAPDGVTIRRASRDDLPACEVTWREGLNDYLLPLGQMEIPSDNPAVRQLHAHMQATDPDLFRVAIRTDASGNQRQVGFCAAVRRGQVWFLSMLFVRPGEQRAGIGALLLDEVMPSDGACLAVATDAAQPISNGLYASRGMSPRLPMFNVVGRPMRPDALPALPAGVTAHHLDASTPAERDRGLDAELAGLDREVLGYAHPEDHDFLRRQGRMGFTYRDEAGRLIAYGYTSEVGRIGPIAVQDADLHAPVSAHLLSAVPPRGASAMWVTGAAGPTLETLIRAGLRIEGFPVLLCWSRPFGDFARYQPASPGLL